MLTTLGFTRGTLVVVSKSSKAHAGEVCVVENFEHLLDGRVRVFNVYLKTRDGNAHFRIPSSFLQRWEPSRKQARIEMTKQQQGDDTAAIIHGQTVELPAQDAAQDDAESVYSVDEAADSDVELAEASDDE